MKKKKRSTRLLAVFLTLLLTGSTLLPSLIPAEEFFETEAAAYSIQEEEAEQEAASEIPGAAAEQWTDVKRMQESSTAIPEETANLNEKKSAAERENDSFADDQKEASVNERKPSAENMTHVENETQEEKASPSAIPSDPEPKQEPSSASLTEGENKESTEETIPSDAAEVTDIFLQDEEATMLLEEAEGDYVILYENGMLVFQNGDAVDEALGAVKMAPQSFLTSVPWREYSSEITEIVFRDPVTAPRTLSSWFSGCTALRTIRSPENLDTSQVVNMSYLFSGCRSLEAADLRSWNMSAVTTIDSMFGGCSSLTEMNLDGWDTGAFRSFSGLFAGCTALHTVSMKSWYLPYLTNLSPSGLFSGCQALESADLSNWNLPAVTGAYMFCSNAGFPSCTNLHTLTMRNLNLPRCTRMDYSFLACKAEVIDISGLYAPNVTDLSWMFGECSRLKQVRGLENLDTHLVTTVSGMFRNAASLETVEVNGWDVSKLKYTSNMFSGCRSLTRLDLCKWDTASLISASSMFSDCVGLRTLNLSGWNLRNSSTFGISGMLSNDAALQYLDLSDWKVGSITALGDAISLRTCTSLQILNANHWDLTGRPSLNQMFYRCSAEEILLEGWDTGKITSMQAMFSGCERLTSLNLKDWDLSAVTTMDSMFYNCKNLSSLNLENWKPGDSVSTKEMFYNCYFMADLDIRGNTLTNAGYTSARADHLQNLKQVSVDPVSGMPDFLYGALRTNEIWCTKDGSFSPQSGDAIPAETTLYRMKAADRPVPPPEREEKEQSEIVVQFRTMIDGIVEERTDRFSIYDAEGNCLASGSSGEAIFGAFQDGETYLVELEAPCEKNYLLAKADREILFRTGQREYLLERICRSRASITADKVWDDADNASGKRPQQLEITLYRNGEPFDTQILSDENHWKFSWPDLFRYDENGQEYEWEVRETVPRGYQDSYSHVETEKDEKYPYINIEIIKTWNDDANAYGLRRPVTFRLWKRTAAGDVELDSRTYDWSTGSTHPCGWYNLPAYEEDGTPIDYYVTEDDMPFYTCSSTNSRTGDTIRYTFVNTHRETKTLKITKKWIGTDEHPQAIGVVISGEGASPFTMSLNGPTDAVTWGPFSITVPQYAADGTEILYSVSENFSHPQYHTTAVDKGKNEFLLINEFHREPRTRRIQVEKTWMDSYTNQNRPYTAELTLGYFENGEWISVETFRTTGNDGWNVNVPEFDAYGKTITYYVKEAQILEDGTLRYGSNAYTPLEVTGDSVQVTNYDHLEIQKIWADADDAEHLRPESIEVGLYQDEELYDTYLLSAANAWKVRVDAPPFLKENGEPILWSARELSVPAGYTMETSKEEQVLTIRNIHRTSSLKIQKQWIDENDADGLRPQQVEIAVYQNEMLYDTCILSEANGWKAEYHGLPYEDADGVISYHAEELHVPEGYTSSKEEIRYLSGGAVNMAETTIRNTHIKALPAPSYEIRKIWKDTGNEHGFRPEEIEAELLADGEVLRTISLSEANDWKVTFSAEELPETREDGTPIEYAVREKNVPLHYEASYISSLSSLPSGQRIRHLEIVNTETKKHAVIEWEITNTLLPEPVLPSTGGPGKADLWKPLCLLTILLFLEARKEKRKSAA